MPGPVLFLSSHVLRLAGRLWPQIVELKYVHNALEGIFQKLGCFSAYLYAFELLFPDSWRERAILLLGWL